MHVHRLGFSCTISICRVLRVCKWKVISPSGNLCLMHFSHGAKHRRWPRWITRSSGRSSILGVPIQLVNLVMSINSLKSGSWQYVSFGDGISGSWLPTHSYRLWSLGCSQQPCHISTKKLNWPNQYSTEQGVVEVTSTFGLIRIKILNSTNHTSAPTSHSCSSFIHHSIYYSFRKHKTTLSHVNVEVLLRHVMLISNNLNLCRWHNYSPSLSFSLLGS